MLAPHVVAEVERLLHEEKLSVRAAWRKLGGKGVGVSRAQIAQIRDGRHKHCGAPRSHTCPGCGHKIYTRRCIICLARRKLEKTRKRNLAAHFGRAA